MAYRVEMSPAAQRDFKGIATQFHQRLSLAILGLSENPRPAGVRKLRGQERTYRIRVGDFRVIYDSQNLVAILKVDRRNESTYR